MTGKTIATLAIGALIALGAATQAQAYKLHYWQDGTISWMCNDGITVGVMDDGSMPPEEVVIAACAAYGGMATTGKTLEAARTAAPRL